MGGRFLNFYSQANMAKQNECFFMNKTTDVHQFSDEICQLLQTPNTALIAIHRLISYGQITQPALQAIYERVMTDNDVDGAYYLIVLANSNDDLPFDGLPLIELLLKCGDDNSKQAMLAKLPSTAKWQLKAMGWIGD